MAANYQPMMMMMITIRNTPEDSINEVTYSNDSYGDHDDQNNDIDNVDDNAG